MRKAGSWIALIGMLLGGVSVSRTVAAPADAARREQMVERALMFLIKQQAETGSLGESRPQAVTALFILATLSAGHLPDDPVYGAALTKAASWMLESSNSGFLGGIDEPIADHALAALALSQLVGTFPDDSFNRRIYERSRQALAYTLDAQDRGSNKDYTGGWAPDVKNRINDRVLTAWCLYQVRANQITQETIGQSSISRGTAFVIASQKRDAATEEGDLGGFSVDAAGLAVRSTTAAGLLTLALFDGERERIALGRQWLLQHPPPWYGPHFFTTNFFAVRALDRTRGPMEQTATTAYHQRLFRLLRERQDGDGRFPFPPGEGGPLLAMGDGYSTAMAVLILNADRGCLPVDQ